jgi:hypothetical protein
MPELGFPNYFIVNKIKQNVAKCSTNQKLCDLVVKAFECPHRVLGSNSSNSCTWICTMV